MRFRMEDPDWERKKAGRGCYPAPFARGSAHWKMRVAHLHLGNDARTMKLLAPVLEAVAVRLKDLKEENSTFRTFS